MCVLLPYLLALYGYFGAVGRLTLHTLPSIVKGRSSRLQHMIYITSWQLREKFQHQQIGSLIYNKIACLWSDLCESAISLSCRKYFLKWSCVLLSELVVYPNLILGQSCFYKIRLMKNVYPGTLVMSNQIHINRWHIQLQAQIQILILFWHKEQKQHQKCKYLPEPWKDAAALMYCQAKEGMENGNVCVFTSKGSIGRQLLWVFTHQLPGGKLFGYQTAVCRSQCFRFSRLGPMWVLPWTRRTVCAAWGNLLILFPERSSRRGSRQQEGRHQSWAHLFSKHTSEVD